MHEEMQECTPMINMLLHQNLLPSFVISYENQIVSLARINRGQHVIHVSH